MAKIEARIEGRKMDRRKLLRGSLSTAALFGAPALLSACAAQNGGQQTSAPTTSAPPSPEPSPEPSALPTLTPTGARFPLITDTVNQLTPASAAKLKSLGVETVFRYYSYVPSNYAGKDLTPAERDVIFAAGMSVGVVFQHWNNCFDTFANDWGARDGEQALALAAKNEQPRGSAIYFGVDGDFPYAALLDDQIRYMSEVKRVFAGSGYEIGVYGGGCALERMRANGLATRFWLSGSTGFTGTKAFYNQNQWTMFQNTLDVAVDGSIGIDTNIANPRFGGAVGQWGAGGVVSGDRAVTDKIFADRRFTRRRVDILAEPRQGARVLGQLRGDGNARAVAEGAGWTEIVTAEGGRGGAGAPIRGFVASAELSSIERFTSQAVYGICGADLAVPDRVRRQNCSAAAVEFRS